MFVVYHIWKLHYKVRLQYIIRVWHLMLVIILIYLYK